QTRILTAWSVRPRSVSVSERLQSRRHRSALRTELSDRLLQDGLAVGFATPLLHVGQMRLVGFGLRRGRRVLGVLTGGETTTGAVPLIRDLSIGREARNALEHGGAVEQLGRAHV